MRATTSGSRIAGNSTSAIRWLIASGRPRGPQSAHQLWMSRLGMPPSIAVGTLGAAGLRSFAVMASALARPSRACGQVARIGSITSCTLPATTSVMAAAVPR